MEDFPNQSAISKKLSKSLQIARDTGNPEPPKNERSKLSELLRLKFENNTNQDEQDENVIVYGRSLGDLRKIIGFVCEATKPGKGKRTGISFLSSTNINQVSLPARKHLLPGQNQIFCKYGCFEIAIRNCHEIGINQKKAPEKCTHTNKKLWTAVVKTAPAPPLAKDKDIRNFLRDSLVTLIVVADCLSQNPNASDTDKMATYQLARYILDKVLIPTHGPMPKKKFEELFEKLKLPLPEPLPEPELGLTRVLEHELALSTLLCHIFCSGSHADSSTVRLIRHAAKRALEQSEVLKKFVRGNKQNNDKDEYKDDLTAVVKIRWAPDDFCCAPLNKEIYVFIHGGAPQDDSMIPKYYERRPAVEDAIEQVANTPFGELIRSASLGGGICLTSDYFMRLLQEKSGVLLSNAKSKANCDPKMAKPEMTPEVKLAPLPTTTDDTVYYSAIQSLKSHSKAKPTSMRATTAEPTEPTVYDSGPKPSSKAAMLPVLVGLNQLESCFWDIWVELHKNAGSGCVVSKKLVDHHGEAIQSAMKGRNKLTVPNVENSAPSAISQSASETFIDGDNPIVESAAAIQFRPFDNDWAHTEVDRGDLGKIGNGVTFSQSGVLKCLEKRVAQESEIGQQNPVVNEFDQILSGTSLDLESLEVVRILGSGGFGTVFKVRHSRETDCHAALKLLPCQITEVKRDLLPELLTDFAIQHHNIIRFFSFLTIPTKLLGTKSKTPLFGVVMEECWGSWRYLLVDNNKFHALGAIAKLALLTDLLLQAYTGVHVLHAAGIAHRDLKPENLLVGKDGYSKITDLGLSKKFSTNGSSRAGVGAGTPGYLGPGQKADDVYALGITLMEILTRVTPHGLCAWFHQHCTEHTKNETKPPKKSSEDLFFEGNTAKFKEVLVKYMEKASIQHFLNATKEDGDFEYSQGGDVWNFVREWLHVKRDLIDHIKKLGVKASACTVDLEEMAGEIEFLLVDLLVRHLLPANNNKRITAEKTLVKLEAIMHLIVALQENLSKATDK